MEVFFLLFCFGLRGGFLSHEPGILRLLTILTKKKIISVFSCYKTRTFILVNLVYTLLLYFENLCKAIFFFFLLADECVINNDLQLVDRSCITEYSILSQEQRDFDPGWQQRPANITATAIDPWKYQSFL